jgi:hypothetical protein
MDESDPGKAAGMGLGSPALAVDRVRTGLVRILVRMSTTSTAMQPATAPSIDSIGLSEVRSAPDSSRVCALGVVTSNVCPDPVQATVPVVLGGTSSTQAV